MLYSTLMTAIINETDKI